MKSFRNLFLSFVVLVSGALAHADSQDLWYSSTSDGSTQYAIYFYSPQVKPRATLLFVHGMQSHAEWLRASRVGHSLADAGIAVLAFDRRGSGRSSTTRGHADSAEILIRDLDDARAIFRKRLSEDKRIPNPNGIEMHLMANCFGARIAVPYLIGAQRANSYPFSTLTLIAPSTHMTKQADYEIGEKLGILTRPRLGYLATPLRNEWFTTYGPGLAWIENDQLGLHQVTAGFLRSASSLTKIMERNIYGMQFPLLIFTAKRDVMVDSAGVKRDLYEPYRGPKRLVEIDSEHSLEFSRGSKDTYVKATIDWILGSGRKVWKR